MSRDGADLFGWFADAEDEPLSAIFTTFNFEPEYFDLLLLPTILQMKIDGSITSGAQYAALLQKLKSTPVAVIADGRVNLKVAPKVYGYDFQPVMDRTQHAKVFLVEYESTIRLVVGSANLSESGIHNNREIVAAMEIGASSSQWHILRDALAFIAAIGDRQLPNLRTALSQMQRKVELLRPSDDVLDLGQQFIGLAGDQDRLDFSKLAASFLNRHGSKKRDRLIKSIAIVSPYFEDPAPNETSLVTTIAAEAEEFNRESLKSDPVRPSISIYVPTTGEMIVTKFPKEAYTALAKSDAEDVAFHSNPTSQDTKGDRQRFPHGKVYIVGGESYTMVIGGSSNFSATGFGRATSRSNIEANLAFFYPTVKRSIVKELTPKGEALDLGAVSEASYDAENPDGDRGAAVILQATFEAGTLTVHVSKSFEHDAFKLRIDQTVVTPDWSNRIGKAKISTLSHHILGVFGPDGSLVQYFPIFVADGTYNPMKSNVTQAELESWIESRYLSSREPPFPGTQDFDVFGPDGLASAAPKDLKAIETTTYVVYRAREFTRLLIGVAARLAPIKDLSKRLEYHLGEEFGLINLVRRHLENSSADRDTILGPYAACELITVVAQTTGGQVDPAAIQVRAAFDEQSRDALSRFLAQGPHLTQITDYVGLVLGLLDGRENESSQPVLQVVV